MNRPLVILCVGACLVAACSRQVSMPASTARVSLEPFGRAPNGDGIDIITLRNQHGMEVRAMSYGGIILSIKVPDRSGQPGDVVLGHDTAAEYFSNSTYFGAIIGRYGNRIAKGKFTLDGKTYSLATNNGANHLHGGTKGWDQAVWHDEPFQDKRGVGVVFTHTSPDGDEGYPGKVDATVTYTLTDDNALVVDYSAKTDKPTVLNLTQHSYFNLSAGVSPDILGHELTINADHYTPIDDGLIPTGEIAPVQGTPFDFRKATPIGARINQKDAQLQRGKGYDHNFVLNRSDVAGQPPALVLAARVVDPSSGRTLEVSTTQPGLQFYSGNFLDGTVTGKGGVKYGHRAGFCLETQHFPDSPNHPNFPSTVLRPGETYASKTVFKFGVQ